MDKIQLLIRLHELLDLLKQKQTCVSRGYLIYIEYEIDVLKELIREVLAGEVENG